MAGTLIGLIDRAAAFMARPPEDRSGLLLITSGGLGDTVLLSLVLPRLATIARPGEKVTVLMRRDAAKMSFLFPPEFEVEAIDYKALLNDRGYRYDVMTRLADAGYRCVVSTDYLRHPLLDDAMIRACRAEEVLGMEPRPWAKYDARLQKNRALFTRLFDSGPKLQDKVLRWTAFADWLTGTTASPPKVRLPEKGLPPRDRSIEKTVYFQPFSAVGAKQSPPEVYLKIMQALPEYRFVMLGGPNDLPNNPDFQAILDAGANFDGAFFDALVPKLKSADLVVSVDTALMHLSVALGAPTLCLASAAYVGEIVPYAPEITPDNVTFVYHPMPCQGCLGACIHALEDGMYPCVHVLDADRIVTAAKTALREATA